MTSETTERCTRCCAEVQPEYLWQTYTNGKRHMQAVCPKCKRFIRYVEQTSERIAVANREHRETKATSVPSWQSTNGGRKRAVLTCRHCGAKRYAGALRCDGCLSPWVLLRSTAGVSK